MKPLTKLKEKAEKLRKQGLSYNEIQKQVKVAKSSLSLWLKDIELSSEHKKRLYTKQVAILALGPYSQKKRRQREVEEITNKALSEIKLPLPPETFKMMGAALYWAEGSKTQMFQFTNSDPHMILFFVRWVELIFSIMPKSIKAHLNIYPQQNETTIKNFWSDLTGIPIKNFGKSFIKPLSKNYKKNNLYYGTVKIEVPKSTDMRIRTFGWIKAVLSEFKSKVEFSERKWQSLREVKRPVNL